MKHQKCFVLFCLTIFAALITHAQSTVVEPSMEITKDRDMYSKTYLKPNGIQQAVISGGPVHYLKNGVWEDINTNFTPTTHGYQNETNVIQSYFPNRVNGSEKIKLTLESGDNLFIHAQKEFVYLNDGNELNGLSINLQEAEAMVKDNILQYTNIAEGISDEFSVLTYGIKNNVILSSPPTFLSNTHSGYFGFSEKMELPFGWKITTADNLDHGLTSSYLHILNANDEHVLTMPAPVFFDEGGPESDGASMIEGKYLLEHEDEGWTVTTLVPVEWLKNENTHYPVSIDPTLTVAGSFGGWQSPNNWVDNTGFVFIGVCCGNMTHRAWIKFNTSSIPDGTCIQMVELQVNVYTSGGPGPELTHVRDVTGAFGNYGGIVPAAYNDFGTGYYTSFTITNLGVYGYYNLGASACSLLQAQLPLNWFQPALMFDNEPSTVYKNINGANSNLRVTYPCALPVELLSFDAKCNNDRVDLSWTTASETNNHYFTIGRSKDGINYEVIGTVNGTGNSNEARQYSFVDPESSEGTVYYYLKQTDYDGTEEYLDLATINCSDATELNIYPNPSAGIFTIEGAEQDDDIIITDLVGQIVLQTKVTTEQTQIDLSQHLNGTYFIQRVSKNGVASRKMVISK